MAGIDGQGVGGLRTVCVLLHLAAQLLHGNSRLLQRRSLVFGVRIQLAIALRNACTRVGHGIGIAANICHHRPETALHMLQLRHQAASAARIQLNPGAQVALRHGLGHLCRFAGLCAQHLQQAVRNPPAQQHGGRHGKD